MIEKLVLGGIWTEDLPIFNSDMQTSAPSRQATIKATDYTKYGLLAQQVGQLHDRFGNDHTEKSTGSANCS